VTDALIESACPSLRAKPTWLNRSRDVLARRFTLGPIFFGLWRTLGFGLRIADSLRQHLVQLSLGLGFSLGRFPLGHGWPVGMAGLNRACCRLSFALCRLALPFPEPSVQPSIVRNFSGKFPAPSRIQLRLVLRRAENSVQRLVVARSPFCLSWITSNS
jgi:hypothetical protein